MIDFFNHVIVYGLLAAVLVFSIMAFSVTILPLIMFFMTDNESIRKSNASPDSTSVKLNSHDFDLDS
jgi:hypothetical protein